MNLIDMLGGYDLAKNAYNNSNGEDIRLNEICTIQKSFLGGLLLEYRRQNEIYEIGDLVVFKEEYSKDSVIHKIDSLRAGTKCLRHATDEEIEKGCRL